MSYILCLFKCCCGPNGCSIPCIGPIRESSTTRMMYSIMLATVSVLLIFIHDNKLIQWVTNELNFNGTCIILRAGSNCKRLSGYKAIYRIAFAFSLFHLSMALIAACVSTGRGWRARIHNGFWLLKFLVIFLFWVTLYLMPTFEQVIFVSTIIGVVAAFMFIIIEDVSLIDCAYQFNGYLRTKGSTNCCFEILLYAISAVIYSCTVAAFVFMYYEFAMPSYCIKNRVIIIGHSSVSFFLIISSFFVNQYNKCKLYIPGGVTGGFVAFLTWNAICSAPDEMRGYYSSYGEMYNANNGTFVCRHQNQFFTSNFGQDLHSYLGIVVMIMTAIYSSIKSTVDYKRYGIQPSRSKIINSTQFNDTHENIKIKEFKKKTNNNNPEPLSPMSEGSVNDMGLSISNINVEEGYFNRIMDLQQSESMANVTSPNQLATDNEILDKQTYPNSKSNIHISEYSRSNCKLMTEKFQIYEIDEFLMYDENEAVRYSYSWLHFVFALAYLFVMVQLTDWYSPDTSNIRKFSNSWPSMWMKIIASWVVLLLYGWTLVCPTICIGRKLYEYPLDSMKRYKMNIENATK